MALPKRTKQGGIRYYGYKLDVSSAAANYPIALIPSSTSCAVNGVSVTPDSAGANDYFDVAHVSTTAATGGVIVKQIATGIFNIGGGITVSLDFASMQMLNTGDSIRVTYVNVASEIKDVSLTNVDITGTQLVGGLAGRNGGTITNSSATGTVGGNYYIGGLAGWNEGYITNSNAGVAIMIHDFPGGMIGNSFVGGLAGWNYGDIINSYATGSVNSDASAGGLAGTNYGNIVNSYATGNVNGGTNAGGLVDANLGGCIACSYATGDVMGAVAAAGLVWGNWGEITMSYAEGNVDGFGYIGGLVGINTIFNTITNSYATGSATGSHHTGGFVGHNDGGITDSYSIGNVTPTGLPFWTSFGGFAGGFDNIFGGYCSSSFWNTQTSGQGSSACGDGRTTAQMKTESTFTSTGWDFTTIWDIQENVTYPYLLWGGACDSVCGLSPPNNSPTADANGPYETTLPSTSITLDGSGSSDPEDSSSDLTYNWSITNNDANCSPTNPTGMNPVIDCTTEGTSDVTLTVTDTGGLTDSDSTTIAVNLSANSSPTAINLSDAQNIDCEDTHPDVYLSWEYSDPNDVPVGTDPQSKYRIQVDNNSDFSSPVVDYTADSSSSTEYATNVLDFNTKYYWKVEVWDSYAPPASGESAAENFTTGTRCPKPGFNWDPGNPEVETDVTFTDSSDCYASPCTCTYTFQDATIPTISGDCSTLSTFTNSFTSVRPPANPSIASVSILPIKNMGPAA